MSELYKIVEDPAYLFNRHKLLIAFLAERFTYKVYLTISPKQLLNHNAILVCKDKKTFHPYIWKFYKARYGRRYIVSSPHKLSITLWMTINAVRDH